jgi:hypothetical protein
MKNTYLFLTTLFLLYIGCDDENSCDVELWGECYSIADTDSLNLSMQQLTGPIPPEIGKLTNLTGLNLSSNQLTGKIPDNICDIYPNLSFFFSVTNNQLCPPYPDCLSGNVGQQDTSGCN